MADVIATIEKMLITRVTNELVEGDKGTLRKVHQYIYCPSDIKYLVKDGLIYCYYTRNEITFYF